MKKIIVYFLFLTTVVFAAPGKLIIIDGLSCSGKTTVVSNLLPLLDESYTLVTLDDFVTKLFLQREVKKIPEDTFQRMLSEARQNMYDTLVEKINSGKNVIFDTLLMDFNGEKDFREALDKLKDLQVLQILIYCPLSELSRRMVHRNEISKKQNNRGRYRPLFLLFKFDDMFKKHAKGEKLIGKISTNEIETAYQVAKNETKDLKKLDFLKEKFIKNLSLEPGEEVDISPRIEYDYYVDTTLEGSIESALKIRNFIQRAEPKAFAQNLKNFFASQQLVAK